MNAAKSRVSVGTVSLFTDETTKQAKYVEKSSGKECNNHEDPWSMEDIEEGRVLFIESPNGLYECIQVNSDPGEDEDSKLNKTATFLLEHGRDNHNTKWTSNDISALADLAGRAKPSAPPATLYAAPSKANGMRLNNIYPTKKKAEESGNDCNEITVVWESTETTIEYTGIATDGANLVQYTLRAHYITPQKMYGYVQVMNGRPLVT